MPAHRCKVHGLQGALLNIPSAADTPLSPLGSSGTRGPLSGSIDADLTDLTCMLTPSGQARSPTDASSTGEVRSQTAALLKAHLSRFMHHPLLAGVLAQECIAA